MLGEKVALRELDDGRRVREAPRSTADTAWLAALPCAVAVVAALLLLGPPLSDALKAASPHLVLLPGDHGTLTPEPREAAGYMIVIGGACLLALAVVVLHRVPPQLPSTLQSIGVVGAQLLLVALLIVCFAGQHGAGWTFAYFSVTALVAAAAFAVGVALVGRRQREFRRRLSPPRARAWNRLMLAAACLAAAIWLLPGVNTEASITWSAFYYDTGFPFDETFAVLNGLTPLANFNAQYASLLPYLIALPMLAFGKTVLVFTITMCALSGVALMAVYGVLRRAARSATIALALFLPTLATTLFDVPIGVPGVHFTAGGYFGMMPLRYVGPYALAWLLARHLERSDRMRTWPLFAAGGLVWLNNLDFGTAALGATVAALLATSVRGRRDLARLVASIALGVLAAVALIAMVTLVRAGSLPDIGAASRYSRLYGLAGYSAAPLPGIVGLPLVLSLTYAAAVGAAVVRAIDQAPNRVLTGLLAWSGVFGFGTGSYYVARSVPAVMPFVFSAWALTLALLALAVRETVQRSRDVSLPAALAVLFGLGLCVCSIAQVPAPWREVARMDTPPPDIAFEAPPWASPPPQAPEARRFVASILDRNGHFVSRAGAPVALFGTTGHRIADAYGVVDVVPFTGAESMHTLGELEGALDRLRNAGGNTVLLQAKRVAGLHHALEQRGFRLLTTHGIRITPVEEAHPLAGARVVNGLTKWIDMTGRRS